MASFGSSNDDGPLCANNCGFYGNPKNQNLCSLCYAAFLKQTGEDSRRPRETSNDFVITSKKLRTELGDELEPNLETETSESVADLNIPTSTKTKNRCKICKKKIGMLGFKCRCGGSFCGKHRHPEEHSCDLDHKAIGREILANQIVECKADKLEFRV